MFASLRLLFFYFFIITPLSSYAAFQLSPSTLESFENQTHAILSVQQTDTSIASSIQYRTVNITAEAGDDYVYQQGTLNWAGGAIGEQIIQIPIIHTAEIEADEQFKLELFDTTNTVIQDATITIKDVKASSYLQFVLSNYSTTEASPELTILVSRTGTATGQVSVNYETHNGGALAGEDYTQTAGTLTWAEGDLSPKSLIIPIHVDTITEPDEHFTLSLTGLQGDVALGQQSTATVSIIDTPVSGSLEFGSNIYVAAEGTLAGVTVKRLGTVSTAASVKYTTLDATAHAGTDYIAAEGELTWEIGDNSNKMIHVNLIKDEEIETDDYLQLTLSQPTGGVTIGVISTTQLRIADELANTGTNTLPSSISSVSFSASNYQQTEDGSRFTVQVRRVGNAESFASVKYKTVFGTAEASTDFISTEGMLEWAAGDSEEKTFFIDLVDNIQPEDEEQFSVMLFDPINTQITDPNKTILTILDNDNIALQFTHSEFSSKENEQFAIVNLARIGGTVGQVRATYTTVDNTAKAGTHYRSQSGQVVWGHGDSATKSIQIPLIDNRDIGGNVTFTVMILEVSSSVSIGTPNTTQMTIIDNDPGGCTSLEKIDCYYQNKGTLTDIIITEVGTVSGGTLGGTVQSLGVIEDLNLASGAEILGGIVRGSITGNKENPALLSGVTIEANTKLTNVVIATGAKLEDNIQLGHNVRFAFNHLIPNTNLTSLLGYVNTDFAGQKTVNLSTDVLEYPAIGGILGAMNSLYEIQEAGVELQQHPETGVLTFQWQGKDYSTLPTQVNQVLRKQVEQDISMGVYLNDDGSIRFITYTGREIVTYPVVQYQDALKAALADMNLNTVTLSQQGIITVPFATGEYYCARAALSSTTAPTGATGGIYSEAMQGINASVIYLNYSNDNGVMQKHYLYPTAAHPESLYGLSADSESVLNNDGYAEIHVNSGIFKKTYRGYFDYAITSSNETNDLIRVKTVADRNVDGRDDYQITYPNGDKQLLYALP